MEGHDNNSGVVVFVRRTQIQEGCEPCYQTGKMNCPYERNCCWVRGCKGFPKASFIFRVEKE